MKIKLTLTEGLEIIENHFKSLGMNVDKASLLCQTTGQVRDPHFEIAFKSKEK